MYVIVWLLLAMGESGIIQISRPMYIEEECRQLAVFVHAFNDTGTLCVKRKVFVRND